MSVKICTDCKHCFRPKRGLFNLLSGPLTCSRPEVNAFDAEFLAEGVPSVLCYRARFPGQPCGHDGKLFEAQP